MIYGLWQSAGGMAAQEYRQNILSNNLANADTPGFKPDRVSFRERLNSSLLANPRASDPTLATLTGGVFESQLYTDFSLGSFEKSDSRLDVALDGPGFFKVQGKKGAEYTRDGRMAINSSGTLIHAASGRPMLGPDNRPIVLDTSNLNKVKIDDAGKITQGEDVAGTLGVVEFKDPQQLEKIGQNLFSGPAGKAHESKAGVRQGFFEASGVQPVDALVDMIAASRAYQLNATMISLQDQSLSRAVNDVGRIG